MRQVVDLKAHAHNGYLGPDQGRIDHFPGKRFPDRPDQIHVVLWHEALEHDFLRDHMLLDDVPPQILDKIDNLVVRLHPPPVHDRDKDHGVSPMSANFSFTSARRSSVSISSLATNENFSAP